MSEAMRRAEIEANYDFFQRSLGDWLCKHEGQFALLRRRKLVDFFDAAWKADQAGLARFPDGLFSIQQVDDEPVELGIYANVPD